MRVGLLALVVAALAALLLLLLGGVGGADSHSYEVEYAVAAIYEATTGRRVVEIARWVLGVGEENYTVWQQLETMYTFYAATEGGHVRIVACAPNAGCGRLPRDLPYFWTLYLFIRLPPGGVEVGSCEHLGLRGVVYRYRGVEVLLPFAQLGSRNLEVCSWRNVVLWMRVEGPYELLWVNATYIRPYDKSRYWQVLDTVKRYAQ
jgi:hypothetical protein